MKLLVFVPKGYEFTSKHVSEVKKTANIEVFVAQNEEEFIRNIANSDILICSNSNFNHNWIQTYGKIKWIHAMSAGVEKILEKLPEKILLANAKGIHSVPISEQVLGYMIMHERKLDVALKAQIKNKWINGQLTMDDKPGELCGKSVAVVGLGSIGRKIAKLCDCLGMKILAVKKTATGRGIYAILDLNAVLVKADYVVLVLPYTSETHHLFGMIQFSHMKNSAFFINVGRGSLVDEPALIDALKMNKIAGAALDVFETEPLAKGSELWQMENVIITPHIAGYSPTYMDKFTEIFCENLKSYLKNEKLPNLVDRDRGY